MGWSLVRFVRPNRRFLRDALRLQLRRAHRAAKPERYAETTASLRRGSEDLDILAE